jgi:hypothetical protein
MKPKTSYSKSQPASSDHPNQAPAVNSEGHASGAGKVDTPQSAANEQTVDPVSSAAPGANPINARQAELTAALQGLAQKLQIASAYNPAQPDHGRSSARIALIGVQEFLSVLCHNAPTLPLALEDLLIGLVDLDRGTAIPLLRPAKVTGRRPKPLSEDLFRALVAAATTSLMKNREIDRELAARDIAGRLSKLGYRLGRLPHVKIQKWREKMMAEPAAENLAVQRYFHALRLVEGKEPSEAANFLLANAAALYPAEFPKKGTFK